MGRKEVIAPRLLGNLEKLTLKFHHLAPKSGWNAQKMRLAHHWKEILENMGNLGVCNTDSSGPWMYTDTALGPREQHREGRAQLHHGFEGGSPHSQGCPTTYCPWPTSPEGLVLDTMWDAIPEVVWGPPLFSSEGSYEEQVWWPACAQVWGSSYTGWFYREKQIKVPAFPLTSSKTQATGDSLNVNATGGCKGSGSLTAESSSSCPPSATAAMKLPDLKTRQPQAAPAPSAASLGCCHTFFSIPTKQELH